MGVGGWFWGTCGEKLGDCYGCYWCCFGFIVQLSYTVNVLKTNIFSKFQNPPINKQSPTIKNVPENLAIHPLTNLNTLTTNPNAHILPLFVPPTLTSPSYRTITKNNIIKIVNCRMEIKCKLKIITNWKNIINN